MKCALPILSTIAITFGLVKGGSARDQNAQLPKYELTSIHGATPSTGQVFCPQLINLLEEPAGPELLRVNLSLFYCSGPLPSQC